MFRTPFRRLFRFPLRSRAMVDADIREEFQFHLDMRAADLERSGMPGDEARAQAAREFGDAAAGAASCARTSNRLEDRRWLAARAEDLLRDLRFGWRLLRRSPGLSLVAILTLALGIGANTAMFSMFEQTLLRPLPVADPASLVNLGAPGPKPGGDNCNQAGDCDQVFSYPMYEDLERLTADTVSLAAHRAMDVTIVAPGGRSSAWGMATLVSGSYFAVLRQAPALGRLIDETDDVAAGGTDVAVVSDEYWRARLGGRADVLGQTLMVNDYPLTIVGVAAPGFAGTTLGIRPAVFVPITLKDRLQSGAASDDLHDRRQYWVYVFGRLAPGVTEAGLRAAVNVPYRRILNEVEAPLLTGASDLLLARFRAREATVDAGARGQ
ncbi:MAG: ABC transporter permease, partial [Vicinamibacterales bacterium]